MKKIFEGNIDGEVHSQFQKFSRGEFLDRAMIRIKNSKGSILLQLLLNMLGI